MKKNLKTGKSICSRVGVLLVCTLLIGALSACGTGGSSGDKAGKDESTVSASDSAAEAVQETEKDSGCNARRKTGRLGLEE